MARKVVSFLVLGTLYIAYSEDMNMTSLHGEEVTLPCGENPNTNDYPAYRWLFTYVGVPDAIVVFVNDSMVEHDDERFEGRVTADYPSGNLTITDSSMFNDIGRFTCQSYDETKIPPWNTLLSINMEVTGVASISAKVDDETVPCDTTLLRKTKSKEGQINCTAQTNPPATNITFNSSKGVLDTDEEGCTQEGPVYTCWAVSKLDADERSVDCTVAADGHVQTCRIKFDASVVKSADLPDWSIALIAIATFILLICVVAAIVWKLIRQRHLATRQRQRQLDDYIYNQQHPNPIYD